MIYGNYSGNKYLTKGSDLVFGMNKRARKQADGTVIKPKVNPSKFEIQFVELIQDGKTIRLTDFEVKADKIIAKYNWKCKMDLTKKVEIQIYYYHKNQTHTKTRPQIAKGYFKLLQIKQPKKMKADE